MAKALALRLWESGTALSEAWYLVAANNPLQKTRNVKKIKTRRFPPKSGMGMLQSSVDTAQNEGLIKILNDIEIFTESAREKLESENQYKNEFIEKLRKGELLAFGYSMESSSTSPPIQIPPRFFVNRFFNWELDVILDPPIEFRQVRIIRSETIAPIDSSPRSNKSGRPSDQPRILEALKVLANRDPSFRHKQRKIQSEEIKTFISSQISKPPSVRTISKSIPGFLKLLF